MGENTGDVCINTITVQTGNGGRQSKLKDWNDDQSNMLVLRCPDIQNTLGPLYDAIPIWNKKCV